MRFDCKKFIGVVVLSIFWAGMPGLMAKAESDYLSMAKEALKDGVYDVAEGFARKALKQEQNLEAIFTIARIYIAQKKAMDAVKMLSQVNADSISSDEKGRLYFLLGMAYEIAGDNEKAADLFKNAAMLLSDGQDAAKAVKKMTEAYEKASLIPVAKKALVAFQVEKSIPGLAREQAGFLAAELEYKRGNYDKARGLLEDFIADYPDSAFLPTAYFYLADIYLKQGNQQEALDIYDKMQKAYAGNKQVLTYALEGKIWLNIKNENIDEAKALFQRLISDAKPNNDEVLFIQATIAFKEKDFALAEKALKQLVEDYSDSKWFLPALYWLAESLANQGEYSKAVTFYMRVISNPDTPSRDENLLNDAYYGLAWAYLHQNMYKEAISAFRQLSDISDDDMVKASALCHVADALQEKGSYEEAIEQYQKIEEKYPDGYFSDYITYQIGNCLLKMEDYDKAILTYKEFLGKFPSSSFKQDVIYNLAIAYFNKGAYDETIEALKRLDNSKRMQSHIIYITALSYYNLGRYKNALHLFRALLDKEHDLPNRPDVEYELAWSYYRLGREKEAYKRFRDIVDKYPDEPITQEVLLWLIEDAISSKKFEIARQYIEKFKKRYKSSLLYWTVLYDEAWLSYLKGGKEQAVQGLSYIINTLAEKTQPKEEFSNALLARAYIYKEMGKKDEALADLKRVVDLGLGNLKKAYITMADVYKSMGRIADAIYSLNQALKCLPQTGNASLQFKIGELWQEAGEIGKAIDAYVKVVYSYSGDNELSAKACMRAARLYEKKGDLENAKQLYNKIISMAVPDAQRAKERLAEIKEESGDSKKK